MPHWLIYAATIAGRVLAGLLACACFYMAIFLYEDEAGILQNRLENTWVAIDDRAKQTRNTAVALFNRIANILVSMLNYLFGKRLFSLRGLIVSFNLSLAAFLLFVMVTDLLLPERLYHSVGHVPSKPAMIGVCLRMSGITLVCALFPAWIKRRWALIPALLPVGVISFLCLILISGHAMTAQMLGLQPVIVVLSFLCDYLAVVLLRKLFMYISKSASLWRIAASMVAMTAYATLVWFLPISMVGYVGKYQASPIGFHLVLALIEIFALNVATAFLCLIPTLVLAFLLLHRAFWPTLGRLIYPLSRFNIVTNRKVLFSVGGLSLLVAFNLETIGIREILKLFS